MCRYVISLVTVTLKKDLDKKVSFERVRSVLETLLKLSHSSSLE